jgi:hypothetical protein
MGFVESGVQIPRITNALRMPAFKHSEYEPVRVASVALTRCRASEVRFRGKTGRAADINRP